MEIIHKKSTAYYLAIPMVDSTTPANFKTGVSPTDTAYYKDGAGSWTSLPISDTFTEIGSTGVYEIDIASGEISTHDMILIKVEASGAADTFVLFRMYTNSPDDMGTATNQTTMDGKLDDIMHKDGNQTFDPADDSLEAIRDRGDVAWITGGGGGGANQVDLSIEEADTTPIPDVKITVMNSDSTVVLATGTSDTNGEATFALDDGTYKVLLSRIGFTFTVPETLTVDETPESATFNGTEVSVGSPPSADNCRLYEYCVDQDGDALSSITSYAAITDRPYDDGTGMYETQKVTGTYNSVSGLVYWDIVKGATVLVEIEEIGLHKKYTVPDQTSARLGDLTPLA